VLANGLVSVKMGVPNFDPHALPFDATTEADRYALQADGKAVDIGVVSIGNPHAVIRVDSVDTAPVDSLGRAVENHPRFPRRTNVEFMQILTPDHIRLRVYERGVGETQACGTGACGAVVVGRRQGLLGEEVKVDLPGGRLIVSWPGVGAAVWMTGPTATVFEGRVEI
jgi:diaminopimelate epimerase